jgi:hypothetical protein
MEIREGRQSNPVADEVGALVAGVLQSISEEVVNTVGERGRLPLRMLGRLRKRGDGDCGIAFEYAVHDAVISAEPVVVERVADALNKCRIVRGNPASIRDNGSAGDIDHDHTDRAHVGQAGKSERGTGPPRPLSNVPPDHACGASELNC